MIEVVTRRTEHLDHYRVQCSRCHSDLRFTVKDLAFDHDPAGKGEGSAHLTCPVCQSRRLFDYTNSEAEFIKFNGSMRETQEQYAEFQRNRILT